jgi:Rps23 Pro-64 3,4-dihydroxylase Tpa1-like proline 4-hydroxylase
LLLQVAADGTTDIAQQLPKALQQAIVQQISEDNLTPQLLSVLATCAADVQQAQEQQLAQQQEEIAWMRQELTGVQDALVALLQQLQGHAEPSTP